MCLREKQCTYTRDLCSACNVGIHSDTHAACTPTHYKYINTYIHTYIYFFVCVCVCVCMCVYTHVFCAVRALSAHTQILALSATLHPQARQDFSRWLSAEVTHCNTQQHLSTHCTTLQHTATHCNTLQHTTTHHTCKRVKTSLAGCQRR